MTSKINRAKQVLSDLVKTTKRKEIAAELHVHPSYISTLMRGESWGETIAKRILNAYAPDEAPPEVSSAERDRLLQDPGIHQVYSHLTSTYGDRVGKNYLAVMSKPIPQKSQTWMDKQ